MVHKTVSYKFYGYKTHMAITEDRIITAVTVTSGEKADGKELKELKELPEKTLRNGLPIKKVVADSAY